MRTVTPVVQLVGWTRFYPPQGIPWMPDPDASPAESLTELAGRLCYGSWSRPNPATATTDGYMEHIIDVGHESVFEHASASFYITGVSRSLLCELTRHRHLSFSVRSQRYVAEDNAAIVLPPAIDGADGEAAVRQAATSTQAAYGALVRRLQSSGLPRKQAREAARSVLINATETQMIVTGNLRAWRDVLKRRWHVAADAEMQRLAGLILVRLVNMAPTVFRDFDVDHPGGQQ